MQRTDFVPDGRRAALFGLTLRSTTGRQRPVVNVDAHSELMSAYPWGWTTPDAADVQPAGHRVVTPEGRLVFHRTDPRGWAARSSDAPRRSRSTSGTGTGFRGPQEPPVDLPVGRPGARALRRQRVRQGRGRPAALPARHPAGRQRDALDRASPARTSGPAAATSELDAALARPGRRARSEDRRAASRSRAARRSTCRATGSSSRASSGASRTWPTRCSRRTT